MIRYNKNGVTYYAFSHIDATGMVNHAFSTRLGGVSKGYYSELNLGLHQNDDIFAVKENYCRICEAIEQDISDIVVSDQYHTTNLHIVTKNDKGKEFFVKRHLEYIDGLVTNQKDILLTTYYADCVPLLFLDKRLKVIANCHAGWRGSLDNMAGKTVLYMQYNFGSRASDILVGIGPSISKAHFEVDFDVYEHFKGFVPATAYISESLTKPEKWHIDLWGINQECLKLAGIPSENIEVAGLCTYENKHEFYSHRRDGAKRGNLAAMIALRGL